ncbi:recombinase RecT [Streptomyces xiamenensis]
MSSISNAIATRDNGPAAQIEVYRDDYTALMPSHINPEQWIRLATGAIRGNKDLLEAAGNDVGEFLRELRTAARLGLEPGTEQFYLTPRRSKKHGGRKIIKGIVGYQGIIELIYRAGAASSVVVEVVRERDNFRYTPGRDERPVHGVDWFAEDRGALIGVYAYAVMKDGATSKVVVLNRRQVMEAKAKSDGRNSEHSPWATNEESMWLKTAARRLAKWVPTSAERVREQLQAQGDAPLPIVTAAPLDQADPEPAVDTDTGEVIDGELEPEGGWDAPAA